MTLQIQDGSLLIDSGSLANSADCCCEDCGTACDCSMIPSYQFKFTGLSAITGSCTSSDCNTNLNDIWWQYDCDVDGTTSTDSPIHYPGSTQFYLVDSFSFSCLSTTVAVKIFTRVEFFAPDATYPCGAIKVTVILEENTHWIELVRIFEPRTCPTTPDATEYGMTATALNGQGACDFVATFQCKMQWL